MEINGIAHIHLTVNNLEKCLPFYERLLNHMGLQTIVRAKKGLYCIGGKTAVAITRSDQAKRDKKFDQRRIGLHHICFRARSREDIDNLHGFLLSLEAKIIHPPEDGPWFPGYYSLLFEDPDGIRLEINHVPGRGYLSSASGEPAQKIEFPLTEFPGYEDYPEE